MGAFDVAVVGGGLAGTAAAYFLAKRGQRVLLVDQDDIPNPLSASGDHARVFRYTHGKDLFYTELSVRTLGLWKEFQKEAQEELFVNTGLLDLATQATGHESHSYEALSRMKLPVERLDAAQMRERFRIFNPRAFRYAVFHPDGGMLWAKRSVAAFLTQALRRRATIHRNVRIHSLIRGPEGIRELRDSQGRTWRAGHYVFATGPWTRELLPAYRLPLRVSYQPMLYFRPPKHQGQYRPAHCPVFSCRARGVYGLPVHIHGFMKIGMDRQGPRVMQPPMRPPEPAPRFETSCRGFLRFFLPHLAGFSEAEGKMQYRVDTPDGDFILDRLPDCRNAILATGFSGHGFMFGPLIGETIADLILRGKAGINLQRFRIGRFRKR